MVVADIQYVSNEEGRTTSVLVPIDLWREVISETETAYLLKSKAMKRRLLDAKEREEGIPFEVVREELRI